MNDTSLATAVSTGHTAWRHEYAAERQRHTDLLKTLAAAATLINLPSSKFSWTDSDGHLMESVPVGVDMHLRVSGDVYLPSLWSRCEHYSVGWLRVRADGSWEANGKHCSSAETAVAALLSTARAASSIATARRRLEVDIKCARTSYEWRVRWSRRAYATIAFLSVIALAGLPLLWPSWLYAILGILALVAALSTVFFLDGYDYDKKTLDTYEKLL